MVYFWKFISLLVLLFWLYVVIIFFAPQVATMVDKATDTNYSSNILSKLNGLLWKVENAKDSTWQFIDWVWTNTKARKQAEIEAIKDIQSN